MANPEHLKILKQGVQAWNKWREEYPDIKPDLSQADLNQRDFSGGNLTQVNLDEANLRRADLRKADLTGASLCAADLSEANLTWTDLCKAILRQADLHGADLSAAFMCGTDFSSANLTGAKLTEVNLVGACLTEASLFRATLGHARLCGANLENADLRYAGLIATDLAGAKLTGTKLYGTSRDDWIIKGVACKYVYWDSTVNQRSPKDRDFEPDEFEQLYVALPFFEYVFEHGMSPLDPLIMDRVVQAIREKRPEFDIKIDSINARGRAPSIRFTLRHKEQIELAREEVRKGYDQRIERLEAEKDRLYQLLSQAIDKAGDVRLMTVASGSIVAMDGSTVKIEQHVHYALELQKAIAEEPEESESFAKVAKKTALDIVGEAMKDIAKGQVKEAAKQIVELGKDLGPIIAKTAAYAFFKSML